MTLHDLLGRLTDVLASSGVSNAAFEAKQLLFASFGLDTTSYLLSRTQCVEMEKADAVMQLAQRRAQGEPLQYLIGQWPFLDETFFVGPGVLIPRPETETLTLRCVEILKTRKDAVVYDLCAGTGCIGLTLQKLCPDVHVFLMEKSDNALRYLNRNAEKHADQARTVVLQGDVLCGPQAFPALPPADLIVSNPPYIPTGELPALQREVQMEPRMALDGGADGLLFYHAFASQWCAALKPDGVFAFECGEGQGQAIAALFAQDHMSAEIQLDFQGFDRFVFISQSRKETL